MRTSACEQSSKTRSLPASLLRSTATEGRERLSRSQEDPSSRVEVPSFQAQNVGAHVGEEHAGVGTRPDPGEFEHLQAREWSSHRVSVGGRFPALWLIPPEVVVQDASAK